VTTVQADFAQICKRADPSNDGGAFPCIVATSARENHPAPELSKPCRETLNRWYRHLSVGDPIIGPIAAFPPDDQAFFTLMGIRSLMMIPIISGKRFFGFLLLADKQNHREWDNEAVQLSQTAALMIGAYVARQGREATLTKSAEAAKQAYRLKSSIVTTVAHEIRTPLSGIVGAAEVIEDARTLGEVRRHAATILDETKYLVGLVNGLTDYTHLEAKEIRLETAPLNLTAFLSEIDASARPAAQKKRLSFKIVTSDLPRRIVADGRRLGQAISSLVSNAVKFTKSGSIILEADTLSVVDEKATIRFSVRDTGIGIDEGDQQKIFEGFYRADEASGGTGLGIPIANELVRLMGGEISLESRLGLGSRFWFDVTFATLPEKRRTMKKTYITARTTIPTRSRLNILAAEDHSTNQMVIRHHIERFGHRATIAGDGLEVLRFCEHEKFDIILMDIQMPKMDGIEATRCIRTGGGLNKDIPIVAVTASSQEAIRNKCLAAGMNDIITKPLLFERLLDTLNRWTAKTESLPPEDAVCAPKDEGATALPIDYDGLVARLDGDTGFAKTLLEGFCDQTDKILLEMTDALSRNDMERLRYAAHTIKGGALNIIASELKNAASALEESTKTKGQDAAPLLVEIETAYQRLKQYIREEMIV
jgi:signal transduction histidine kinase/CheY-like chemotaxis protein/HPt (histidine-containing phosphotransfer) domain-containing protein